MSVDAAGVALPSGAASRPRPPSLLGVLWRLARAFPWVVLFMFVLHVAYFCVDLGVPLVTRQLFDFFSGVAPLRLDAWALVALLAVSRVGRGALGIVLVVQQASFNLVAGARLRANLMARVLEHPAARALPASPGEAVSRFRDDVDVTVSYMSHLSVNAAYVAGCGAGLVLMLRTDAQLTLLVLAPLVGVVAVSNVAKRRVERYRLASREAAARVSGALGELFGAVQAVQLAGAEGRAVDHLEALGEARRSQVVRDATFNALLDAVFQHAARLGTGTILLLAGQSMRAGTFTVGDFALFVYFLSWIGEYTSVIGSSLAQYRQCGVSLARVAVLLQPRGGAGSCTGEHALSAVRALTAGGAPDVRGAAPAIGEARLRAGERLATLEVRDLTCSPGQPAEAVEELAVAGVRGVSFSLERGSFTVITGRVGSGKTTLLRAVLGLLPIQSGRILWNGRMVEDPAAFFLPPRCAYTPQVPRLFSESLRDNVLQGLPETAPLVEAVRLAALEGDVTALEKGLDTVIGPRGVRLSGGQLQRAAAARMLVRQPELLVVDDLSSALDVETERVLWDGLLAGSTGDGHTVLAVSHRRPALSRASRVVVLKEGRVVGQGRAEELLETCEEMRVLWGV